MQTFKVIHYENLDNEIDAIKRQKRNDAIVAGVFGIVAIVAGVCAPQCHNDWAKILNGFVCGSSATASFYSFNQFMDSRKELKELEFAKVEADEEHNKTR